MGRKSCPLCKVVGLLVIIGAINSGLVGLIHVNYLDKVFSHLHLARVVDILIPVAAVVLLASYFIDCPACKK